MYFKNIYFIVIVRPENILLFLSSHLKLVNSLDFLSTYFILKWHNSTILYVFALTYRVYNNMSYVCYTAAYGTRVEESLCGVSAH